MRSRYLKVDADLTTKSARTHRESVVGAVARPGKGKSLLELGQTTIYNHLGTGCV
jgi:hypothetical protein